jgi:ABC-2 type transport system permease protein
MEEEMNLGEKNIFTIAEKEFTDNIWSSKFQIMLIVLTFIIFSFSVRAGENGLNIFEDGFLDVAQVIGLFLPIVGIALGFDVIVKEKKVNSLDVLLTHPIFRDNIITGKIVGGLLTLGLVILLSVISSVGTMLILNGVDISGEELNRIFIFTIISFIYLSTFFALGVLTSVYSNSSANSLMYNIIIWINLVMVFGAIVPVAASIVTGESILDMESNTNALKLSEKLQLFSPIHHYSEMVTGIPELSVGSINIFSSNDIYGIFNMKFTLEDWFRKYWMNIALLITMPLILFISSFVAFLRLDITR